MAEDAKEAYKQLLNENLTKEKRLREQKCVIHSINRSLFFFTHNFIWKTKYFDKWFLNQSSKSTGEFCMEKNYLMQNQCRLRALPLIIVR